MKSHLSLSVLHKFWEFRSGKNIVRCSVFMSDELPKLERIGICYFIFYYFCKANSICIVYISKKKTQSDTDFYKRLFKINLKTIAAERILCALCKISKIRHVLFGIFAH